MCDGLVCEWIFTKIFLEVQYYLVNLSLKFQNDPRFRCGDIGQIILLNNLLKLLIFKCILLIFTVWWFGGGGGVWWYASNILVNPNLGYSAEVEFGLGFWQSCLHMTIWWKSPCDPRRTKKDPLISQHKLSLNCSLVGNENGCAIHSPHHQQEHFIPNIFHQIKDRIAISITLYTCLLII